MASPLTVEEAQQAAREIARRFGNFECARCAAAIARKLGRGFQATFERLRTSDNSDVIGLVEEDIQISRNRVHVGVRVGDKVVDNLHHEGMEEAEWAGRFASATEAPLARQSRPISDFFGRAFLVKRFNQWLFGP